MNIAWANRLASVFVLTISMISTAGAQEYCAPNARALLDKLAVASERVEEIVYANRMSGGENAEIVGVDAWVQMRDCNGQIVIEMTTGCRITQTYTRKECRIQGVRHSC